MSRRSRCSSLLQSQLLWVVALVLVWVSSPDAPFGCWATDTLSPNVPLSINQTLVSSTNQTFEFGLFSLGNATNRRYYIGIWYYNITPRVYVWVGNRDAPFPSAGADGYNISLGSDGNIRVLSSTSSELWRSNTTARWGSWKAVLWDDGNLVVQDVSGEPKLWRSFAFPTDTFLAGMRISMNETSGAGTRFTSWRSPDDPGLGNYTLAMDAARGSTQLYLRGADGRVRWRSGVYDGVYFNGISGMRPLNQYGFKPEPMQEQGNKGLSFTYFNKTQMRFVLLPNGTETTYIYEVEKGVWNPIWQQPTRSCDFYNFCGNNSFCVRGQPDRCQCLPGFDPGVGWDEDGYLNGTSNSPFRCNRRVALLRVDNNNGTTSGAGNSSSNSSQGQSGQDNKPDGFQPLEAMKVPDFAVETLSARTEEDCRESCLTNEFCTAFSLIDVCYNWSGDLADMFQFNNDSNNGDLRRNATLYVRLAGSEIDRLNGNTTTTGPGGGTNTRSVALAVSISVTVALAVIVCAAFGWRYNLCGVKDLWRRGRTVDPAGSAYSGEQAGKEHHSSSTADYGAAGAGAEDGPSSLAAMSIAAESGRANPPFELPMFTLDEIDAATGSFRESNTLGKGGFGHVYKGVLPGGDLVAVKRLSRDSGQGQDEFKNEVALIARLQHNNLVRLQGCCVQGEERILVYEYMPNKSLDAFLFNPTKQPLLDWRKRFNIIEGVARGLLYLHRDSRLRIVHRDLKASNILLDSDMNPKISDFGMARIFGNTQNQDNTNRIVGTFGYMSPEYAMEGLFSDKSDVYSFGVLTIEIISGRKNNRFRTDDHNNLLSYAWELWNQGRAMELVDSSIHNSCYFEQVIRCVQIALLCVQDKPNDRPKMSKVVIMLASDTAIPTMPKLPAFPAVGSPSETATRYNEDAFSNYDVTITEISGR